MTTTTRTSMQAHPTSPRKDEIVLGVDGSERNQPAIAWAAAEATETGHSVRLVSAAPPYTAPLSGMAADLSPAILEAEAAKELQSVRERFATPPTIYVESGVASRVLTEQSAHSALLVVGKRGLGAVSRLLVGSTSIAVAGRSSVPVVVVPDTWDATGRADQPIVVGIEAHEGAGTGPVCRDATVLDFAFERAERLGVPLVAVSAWELPPVFAWSPIDVSEWRAHREQVATLALRPWTERFPQVEVIVVAPAENASSAVLDAAITAQLVVLGRHTRPSHVGGFTVGSTARGVLHYSDVPVVVVPSAPVDPAPDYRDPEDVAAPMF